MKLVLLSIAGLCFFTSLLAAGDGASGEYLSPHVLVGGGGETLYVAGATSKNLVIFDPLAERVVDTVALPCLPSGMALSPDGSRLYITAASPAGEVYVVDTGTRQAALLARVGHTPQCACAES